ncbi:Recombination enhancement, RecA-dependent nuclease [uncultured Caudovirales phage]|uniref:Recombination enhancement, RecA-dependent nuclease n=1 Tax=uncultured Caudovirales phage TaxID=2100421 RepID=A0A6J5T6M9_9CAUD|nr:Recombination enhancement, RecA-dependent nuclease [uncultured Caudovirales phage]
MSGLAELHLQRVGRLACVACLIIDGVRDTRPVEVHHVESSRHPFSDFLVLPLCYEHHRGFTGVHGRHRLGFEKLHGVTQVQLLGVTTSLLLADRSMVVGG